MLASTIFAERVDSNTVRWSCPACAAKNEDRDNLCVIERSSVFGPPRIGCEGCGEQYVAFHLRALVFRLRGTDEPAVSDIPLRGDPEEPPAPVHLRTRWARRGSDSDPPDAA